MPHTPQEILKAIRADQFRPVYFIHGEEPYLIDLIAEELEKRVIPPAQKDFCSFVLYGNQETNVGMVLQRAKSFPFMADRQLVVVKEAQKLDGIGKEDSQAALEHYALNPSPATVLVVCYQGNADERKKFVKAFDKHGALVKTKKLYENQLPDWVIDYCHGRKVKISPKAAQMLVANIGNDLKRLANEIDKLLVNQSGQAAIDAESVERYIGISKDYNVFELQKALGQKDVLKANRIVLHFAANPKDNPLIPVLIILYNFFSKLLIVHETPDKSDKGLAAALGVNPFFAKDYATAARHYPLAKVVPVIHYLREADSRIKGVEGGTVAEGEILKELVFKILH